MGLVRRGWIGGVFFGVSVRQTGYVDFTEQRRFVTKMEQSGWIAARSVVPADA